VGRVHDAVNWGGGSRLSSARLGSSRRRYSGLSPPGVHWRRAQLISGHRRPVSRMTSAMCLLYVCRWLSFRYPDGPFTRVLPCGSEDLSPLQSFGLAVVVRVFADPASGDGLADHAFKADRKRTRTSTSPAWKRSLPVLNDLYRCCHGLRHAIQDVCQRGGPLGGDVGRYCKTGEVTPFALVPSWVIAEGGVGIG